MEKEVFYNGKELEHELFQASPLSSLFGTALLAYTNADCALFNAGIFLGSLNAGWVTEADLHALLPHSINPCIITLDGVQLLEVFQQSKQPELANIEVKGLGFRGNRMGAIIHERLFQNKYGKLFIGDEEVKPYKKYKLVTLDMFTFGFFFPLLKDAEKEYMMPDLLRDVLAWYGREFLKE
jgi:5'-nucleotidase